ncbi:MAG: hypothetical protein KAI66_02125 [Lentisphaeria bacterium]|nr:hypothetical protein [Lentisphaeria bacterium]
MIGIQTQASGMIVLETETFRWGMTDRGITASFLDKNSDTDMLGELDRPSFTLVRNAETLAATSVEARGGQLVVRFEETDVTVSLGIEVHPSHLVLRVDKVQGDDFDRLFFVDVPLKPRNPNPDAFCACTISLDLRTRVDGLPGPQERLQASCYRKFGVAAAATAVVGCSFENLRGVLKEVVSASDELPHSPLGGPWAAEHPQCRDSYLFCNPSETDVDQWIGLARDFGIDELHFSSGAFSLGDYTPNAARFPNGIDGVRSVVDRIHKAGLHTGMHTLSFSISPASPYVTPVPDPRLGTERILTLATALDTTGTEIPVRENTDDLPRVTGYHIRRSMTLRIEEELIIYTFVEDGKLTGCTRGARGTKAAPHAVGTPVHHLMACWGLYSPGPNSLFEEVAENIADRINACNFDMVYLDGLDGVHIIDGEESRWHYGGHFAFEVHKRLKRPVLMEMAAFLHHLWFLRGRMGAWDHAQRGHKKFIDLHCRSNANCQRIFLPAHLGWWAPRVSTGPTNQTTHVDDAAYLASKGLASDIGFALQGITPESVKATPQFARLAPVFKRHEELRRSGAIPERWRKQIAKEGAEFALEDDASGNALFRPVQRCDHKIQCAEATDVKWEVISEQPEQSPSLRLELLYNAAAYDAPEAIEIADFAQPGEFTDSGPTLCKMNSGKDYTYPAVPGGLSAQITPCTDTDAPDGLPCAQFFAKSAATTEMVTASSPTDDFSLLDHGEKFYESRPASWVRLSKHFPEAIDLTACQALGFWLCGDGSGATLNIQMRDTGNFNSFEDKYVPIDFTGWRYIRLLEAEGDRFESLTLPYGRCVYKIYRHVLDHANFRRLNLWYANIRPHSEVRCLMTPIRALPVIPAKLASAEIEINGARLALPVAMESGQWLEIDPQGAWTVFDPKGTALKSGTISSQLPKLVPGANQLALHTPAGAGAYRFRISLATKGGPLK